MTDEKFIQEMKEHSQEMLDLFWFYSYEAVERLKRANERIEEILQQSPK